MERRTRQRDAIRLVLAEADRPLSPQEVLEAAQGHCPGLGLATVYRALADFVGDGALSVVELPGVPARYEVAGKHHHHHFICRRCARVFETGECTEHIRVAPPPGFVVEDHEVILRGLCGDCAAPA